jgi:hypothetical protein
MVKSKVKSDYSHMDLEAHVAFALDMLHANRIVKRVAPRTWEADSGPDEPDSERLTGYAPEGEFAHRGRDFSRTAGVKNAKPGMTQKEYNHMYGMADLSVKYFQKAGKTPEEIIKTLDAAPSFMGKIFARVAIRMAVKDNFNLPFSPA